MNLASSQTHNMISGHSIRPDSRRLASPLTPPLPTRQSVVPKEAFWGTAGRSQLTAGDVKSQSGFQLVLSDVSIHLMINDKYPSSSNLGHVISSLSFYRVPALLSFGFQLTSIHVVFLWFYIFLTCAMNTHNGLQTRAFDLPLCLTFQEDVTIAPSQ